MATKLQATVIDGAGKSTGNQSLPEDIFGGEVNVPLMHQVMTAQLAEARSGTASTKTRSQVSGGGIKPWRQKGTGRARSGSTRSPLWRKGGIIFGPNPRDYRQDLPKKKKLLAFRIAVAGLVEDNRLQIVDPIEISEPKTKNVAQVYARWQAPTDSFYLVDKLDPTFVRASRNIAKVKVSDVATFNTYDALR